MLERNAIKYLATELRNASQCDAALSQQRVNGLVDRIASNIGVTLSPRRDATVAQLDEAGVAAVVAPIFAAMELVLGANANAVPQWEAAFEKAAAKLIDGGWLPTEMGARDRFAAPDAVRRIEAETSYLLRFGTPTSLAALSSLLPTFLNVASRVPDDCPKSRFSMFREEQTGAAAFLALKRDKSPMTTLTLAVDFGNCDRTVLRSALEDVEFTRSFTRSTQKVDGARFSIDASSARQSRDGLSIKLKADIWPAEITDTLRTLGLPPSVGALEAQLEEAMY